MRITPQTLQKIARETVDRRARSDRGLLGAYLHGSLVSGDPVLGGTADIDLVFVHNHDVPVEREIDRLTDEVHLDIVHHTRRDYRKGRNLRLDPWLGPTVYACKVLHDPQHFLDFTQASVRGLFYRPDNILNRAQTMAAAGRQIWMDFYQSEPEPGPEAVSGYLQAVENAANAIATLSGPPLPERRFLVYLPARAEAVGRPGLEMGVLGLLGGGALDEARQAALLPAWEAAFDAVGELSERPAGLHPHRRDYYLRAFQEMGAGEQPLAFLWPLLRTWTAAACHLPLDGPPAAAWQECFAALGFTRPAFGERVAALDAFLDTVEETLEAWGRANGA